MLIISSITILIYFDSLPLSVFNTPIRIMLITYPLSFFLFL